VIEFWREWLNPVISNQWVMTSLAGGLGLLLAWFLFRSGLYIRRFGLVNWLKSFYRIENESWRLIGILMLFVIAAAMVFSQVLG
jgi:hypothetical protein